MVDFLNCEKVRKDVNTRKVFLELVRAGLLSVHGERVMVNDSFPDILDWGKVYRLAEEQAVVGLVSAGLDWFKVNVSQFTIPQEWALKFISDRRYR